jgi:hypothetical protein
MRDMRRRLSIYSRQLMQEGLSNPVTMGRLLSQGEKEDES